MSLFEQAEPSFDFSMGLWVLYSSNNVIESSVIKELLERRVREIAVPGWTHPSAVVGLDLVGRSVFTDPSVQDRHWCFRL